MIFDRVLGICAWNTDLWPTDHTSMNKYLFVVFEKVHNLAPELGPIFGPTSTGSNSNQTLKST